VTIEGKVKVTRETENRKKNWRVSGIWSRKCYVPNDFRKTNQYYLCVWTDRIKNKTISKAWKKWRW